MKILLISLFIISIVLLFNHSTTPNPSSLATPKPTPISTKNWKIYIDKVSNYSISYPSNFEVNINPETDLANEVNFSPKNESFASNDDFDIYDSQDPVAWISSWQVPKGSCGTISSDLCTYNKFTNKRGIVFDHYLVSGKGQFDDYGFYNGNVHLDISFSHYMDKQKRDAIINSFIYNGANLSK